jgi:thiamine kinase-like enzyme
MEQFEKIYQNIKGFLSKEFNIENYNEIELVFEKLNGLSNDIYLVKIFNKSTNEMVHEIIYRKFGEMGDLLDREQEGRIISSLAEQGVSPKIYETDNKTYRIEEFISNAETLDKSVLKENEIIDRIIQILVSYTLISGVYSYNIHSDQLCQDYKINIDPNVNSSHVRSQQRITQNMFDMCMKDMYEKAKLNLDKFSGNFKKKYNKFLNQEVYSKFEKLKQVISNYNDLFTKIFPKNGFFVLNHNDVHRLNLLLSNNKEKIIILDHEYAALNLIGIDIVNYMIETNFDYTIKQHPYYEFKADDIDFEYYFEIFKSFINKFELAHSGVLEGELGKKKFEKMKTFKYFLRLVCVISLFWLLYSAIYLDFEAFSAQKTFDYFSHAADRIFIFEKAYKKLATLNI